MQERKCILNYQHFSQQTERLTLAGFHNGQTQGRPVIMLHGWLDNAATFEPMLERLQLEGRPVYALELPGHGKSQHRDKSAQYHLVDNTIDVLAFVDSISEGSDFDIVGHSMGGIIATLVAASVPERVKHLVLLDSLGPLTDEIENVLPQLKRAVKRASSLRNSKLNVYPTKEVAARARTAGVGKISMPASRLLVERGTIEVEGGWTWSSDPRLLEPSLLRFSEAQVEAIMGGIECPVLLLVGTDGYFKQYEAIKKRLAYIKTLTQHQVDGGHHFHMEGDVALTAQLVGDFVTE
ncbi:MAG: alpha/beta hydrolase [Oleiphilaceae bacterium]|nr:alpha/beta hydrolase [Oleiphilaceae bacterium]